MLGSTSEGDYKEPHGLLGPSFILLPLSMPHEVHCPFFKANRLGKRLMGDLTPPIVACSLTPTSENPHQALVHLVLAPLPRSIEAEPLVREAEYL